MGHYKFNVQGRLLAVGTQLDSIRFTAANTDSGWHGVRFINTPAANDTSKFVYCSFKYGKANTGSGWDRCGGAILIGTFNKVFISDCLFENNKNYGDISTTGGAAIYLKYASPIITNCTFRSNQGTTDCSVLCANNYAVISKSVLQIIAALIVLSFVTMIHQLYQAILFLTMQLQELEGEFSC